MYTNIGKKIKTLAKVLCWLAFAACLVALAADAYQVTHGFRYNVYVGILIIVGGIPLSFLICWIGSFLLYGFGEMIDKLDEIEQNTWDALKK